MKLDNVKSWYTEHNIRKSKFKVDDHAWISKCKKIFLIGYKSNWSEQVFVIKKIKDTWPWTYYVIKTLNDEATVGILYEQELERTIRTVFRIEKMRKKKSNKL